jgi:hypothetical protein
MIVDGMSKGFGYSGTHQLLDLYRLSQGMETVVPSTVYLTVQKCQPNVDKITKQKQDSTDPEATWSRARLGWTKQLLAL